MSRGYTLPREGDFIEVDALKEQGYVMIDTGLDEDAIPSEEWLNLDFMDWKSSGDTRFAPLASADGSMDCGGFWFRVPGMCDKGGVWTRNAEICPTMVQWVESVGATIGRVRVIELQPNRYEEVVGRYIHLDDNNRYNTEGTGWVVRAFLQLTDNPNSYMVLRKPLPDGSGHDPTTEVRIPMAKGTCFIVDSERWYHAVWHQGEAPRYCLIACFESGPELARWIEERRLDRH